MIKLSDTQTILLSNASQRDNGSLFPLPASLKPGGGASKALGVLVKRALAEERETSDAAFAYRTDGDRHIGLFLTAEGASAIGVELHGANDQAAASDSTKAAPATTKTPRKTALVLELLCLPTGATLAELIELTGWLPHTTRAALTGLRKKGHDVQRGKRDGVTFYSVAAK